MSKKKTNSLADLDSLFGSTRVYSTEDGDLRNSQSDDEESIPEGDGVVRLRRETKGRKGKGVTLVDGVLVTPSELKKLAKELKNKCGTGGTVKDGIIEIQGDHRDLLMDVLTQKGFTVKKAGG